MPHHVIHIQDQYNVHALSQKERLCHDRGALSKRLDHIKRFTIFYIDFIHLNGSMGGPAYNQTLFGKTKEDHLKCSPFVYKLYCVTDCILKFPWWLVIMTDWAIFFISRRSPSSTFISHVLTKEMSSQRSPNYTTIFTTLPLYQHVAFQQTCVRTKTCIMHSLLGT